MNESEAEAFRVVVPYRPKDKKLKHAYYPPSGHAFYTRQQAIDILRRFQATSSTEEGGELEPWAESKTERFTLRFPVDYLFTPTSEAIA